MGLRDQLKLLTTADLIAAQETADLVAALSPANVTNNFGFVAGTRFGINRNLAMQVPAVARARNLIAGTVGSLPLELRTRSDNSYVDSPRVLHQPDPRVPGSSIYCWTTEDLLFYGVAYWQVMEVYQEFPNRIKSATRIDPTRVTPQLNANSTEITGYRIDGKIVPTQGVDSIVRFDGLDEGILARGGRTIQTALELEKSSFNFAREPVPSMALKSNGVNLPSERITKLLENWRTSRQNGTTAFLNADVELQQFGHSPKDLQMVEARQYLASEIARLCNIPAWYVGADAGSSMTYTNVSSERRALIDFSIKPFLTLIADRLGMPDFVPQTQMVQFDLNDYLKGNPVERAQVYQILNSIGVLTTEEIRELEDLV